MVIDSLISTLAAQSKNSDVIVDITVFCGLHKTFLTWLVNMFTFMFTRVMCRSQMRRVEGLS